jgi:hypothetical protein
MILGCRPRTRGDDTAFELRIQLSNGMCRRDANRTIATTRDAQLDSSDTRELFTPIELVYSVHAITVRRLFAA